MIWGGHVTTTILGIVVGAAVGVSCTIGGRLGRRAGFALVSGPRDPEARDRWTRRTNRGVAILIGLGWLGGLACAILIGRA